MDGSTFHIAKPIKLKNRAPAPIQITAEQLVLESRDRADAQRPPPPKQHVTDVEELAQHRMRSRKEFEDRLRLSHSNMDVWLRYAKWEESQREVERARSVFERALGINYRLARVWLAYAEMEMRFKFVNRARNVWDRAVGLLPRVDALWYRYTFMEEMLGNVAGARLLFERWCEWEPPEAAWLAYAKLELRAGEGERARGVYERLLACHPSQASYLRYAKWEEKAMGQRALARRLFERALEELRDDERDEDLYAAFAAFEVRCGEGERAKAIYRFGLEHLPKGASEGLYKAYVAFEKQFGDRKGVEDVILAKRRTQYEEALAANALNYDVWFDYVRLEENDGDAVRCGRGRGRGVIGGGHFRPARHLCGAVGGQKERSSGCGWQRATRAVLCEADLFSTGWRPAARPLSYLPGGIFVSLERETDPHAAPLLLRHPERWMNQT